MEGPYLRLAENEKNCTPKNQQRKAMKMAIMQTFMVISVPQALLQSSIYQRHLLLLIYFVQTATSAFPHWMTNWAHNTCWVSKTKQKSNISIKYPWQPGWCYCQVHFCPNWSIIVPYSHSRPPPGCPGNLHLSSLSSVDEWIETWMN